MPPLVVKQITTWPKLYPNSSTSLSARTPSSATPQALYISIQFDGHGYLLLAQEIGGTYTLDHWYPSLAKAEENAQAQFGITAKDWELVSVG